MSSKVLEVLSSMDQVSQGVVTLAVTGTLTVLYWVVTMCRKNGSQPHTLLMFAVNVIGVVTGIYMFVGAFTLMNTSAQNGILSGITGLCISLFTAQNIINELKALFGKEIEPKRQQASPPP